MRLSSDLVSQFVKVTKDEPQPTRETTVYGTVVYDGRYYVKLDGSELLTPVTTTTDIKHDDRVTVMIKDHSAIVTGNMSSPAARTDDVKEVGNKVDTFENIIADKVSTEQLEAEKGRIDTLVSDNATIRERLTATEADIGILEADNATINGKISANEAEIKRVDAEKITAEAADLRYASIDKVDALEGNFNSLSATHGEFVDLTTQKFEAQTGRIDDLEVIIVDAETGKFKFLEADLANITMAELKKIFSDYGVIEELVSSGGTFTKQLVGVTISGDLIEGKTIKADKLLLRDSKTGLYYQMNVGSLEIEDGNPVLPEGVTEEELQQGLLGSVIIAKSITAEKISVDDLTAFGANIAGFKMEKKDEDDDPDTPSIGKIYSGTKEHVDTGAQGVYIDSTGQMSLGDSVNYIKYYRDTADGMYKLGIAIDEITIGGNNKLKDLLHGIKIDPENPSITIGAGENTMSLVLRNDHISFEKNGNQFGWWDGVDFHTGNIVVDVTERAQFGNFAFVPRSDGSLSFLMVESKTGIYGRLVGGVLSIYGYYPGFEGTTMTVDEKYGALEGVTLTLGEFNNG